METDRKLHFRITYVKSLHLPEILKAKAFGMRKSPRPLYAVASIRESPDNKITIRSLDDPAGAPPIMFFAKQSDILEVQLFAKRSSHDDDVIAHAKVQLGHITERNHEVRLDAHPSYASQLAGHNPVITLNIRSADYFEANQDLIGSMQKFIEINPTVAKTFLYINGVLKVGTAVSELDPRAKAVMSVVGLIVSQCEGFVKRHEPVRKLLEALGEICALVVDWDDLGFPEMERHRVQQRRVYSGLCSVIYQALNVAFELSQSKWNVTGIERVASDWQARLMTMAKQWNENKEKDLHIAIFKIANQVENLDNDRIIHKLPMAKDNNRDPLKGCLKGTRRDLLFQIESWALDPNSSSILLLHGAAGNGKSSVVNTVSANLRGNSVAIVPFFAFNRRFQELQLSQLLPAWACNLAQHYPSYMAHLRAIDSRDVDILGSTSIDTQFQQLWANGLASISDELCLPLVFTIDALDECPEPN
ncbi:hypothetical protein AB1N83_010443, partial [Pleurotus pulmonarius]